jgi:hypothetical protein
MKHLKNGVADFMGATYIYVMIRSRILPTVNQEFLQSAQGRKLEGRFRALKEEIATLGWLTHGSVSPNHPGYWRWTRKVKAKTVSVALSEAQAELFRQAIANHRKLEAILQEMRAISQEVLLKSDPGNPKKPRPQNHPKPGLT